MQRLTRPTWALLILAVFALLTTARASQRGWGVPRPTARPVSVREESARGPLTGVGHHRTRFFIGGGIHSAK